MNNQNRNTEHTNHRNKVITDNIPLDGALSSRAHCGLPPYDAPAVLGSICAALLFNILCPTSNISL